MRIKDGKILFVPTGEVRTVCEPCPSFPKQPQIGFLAHTAHYRIGNVFTDAGSAVTAMKAIIEACDLFVDINGRRDYSRYPYEALLGDLGMSADEYNPHYNCFGHCFAGSVLRIPDPSAILRDEFIECKDRDATVIVSFSKGNPVHGVVKQGRDYVAKSGVMRLDRFESEGHALASNPYDLVKYFKTKPVEEVR